MVPYWSIVVHSGPVVHGGGWWRVVGGGWWLVLVWGYERWVVVGGGAPSHMIGII